MIQSESYKHRRSAQAAAAGDLPRTAIILEMALQMQGQPAPSSKRQRRAGRLAVEIYHKAQQIGVEGLRIAKDPSDSESVSFLTSGRESVSV